MSSASALVAVVTSLSLAAVPANVAQAKQPPKPTVRIPSSFGLPWWSCEDAESWVVVKDGKRLRARSYDVTIRKPGYTEPIGDNICGYMGSGTYNFRVKVYMQKPGFKWKKRRVYKTVKWQEFDHNEYGDFITRMTPFQCDWVEGEYAYDIPVVEKIDVQGPYAWYTGNYSCRIPGDPSWGVYYTGNVKYDYTVNRATQTTILWSDLYKQAHYDAPDFPYQGVHSVSSARPGLVTGEQITGEIRVITGRETTPIYVTKTKSKFDHWKRFRVRAWKSAGSFVVTGQVSVKVS